MTYAPAKFEVAMSNSLGGGAFTRKYNILTVDIDLVVKVTRNIAQFPLHHVIDASTKFEVAKSYGLGEDTITRNVTDSRTTERLWYENNIPYFFNEKGGIINLSTCFSC